MFMKNCSIILGSISIVTLTYLYYVKRCYNYLKSLGYDGPKPKFLIGNLLEFVSKENSVGPNRKPISHYSKTLQRWTKAYGKIYGYYEGHSPVLVISDPDLVTDVFLNQNKLVTFRRSFPMSKSSSDPNADIFISNGIRWLRVRYGLEKIMLNPKNASKCLEYADKSFINTFRFHSNLNRPQKNFDISNQIKYFMIRTMFTIIFGTELNSFLQQKPHIHSVFKKKDLEEPKLGEANNLYFTKIVSHKFTNAFLEYESFSILKFAALTIPELVPLWRACEKFKSIFNSYFFILPFFADPMDWFYSNFIQKNLIIYTQENGEVTLKPDYETKNSHLNFKSDTGRTSTRLMSQSQNLSNNINRKQFCYFNSFLYLTYMPIIKFNHTDHTKRRINSVSEMRKSVRLPSLSTINELKKQNNVYESRQRHHSIDNWNKKDNRSRIKSSIVLKDIESEDFENWKFTINEALSNTLLMFFAGYETTSTAITFCCKVISTLPEQREKLLDEIKENWDSLKLNLDKYKIKPINLNREENEILDSSIELNDSENDDVFEDEKKLGDSKSKNLDEWNELYETLENMKYLDMFVKEVLRMFPIANSMVSRKCVVDNLIIDNGNYRIPNGMNIVVDVLSIHYDPVWWGPTDPNIFYPERFLTERHPAAWLAFGVGSRKCLGVKLAISQIKLFVVRLLQNYVLDKPKLATEEIADLNRKFVDSIETKDVFFTAPTSPICVSIAPKNT